MINSKLQAALDELERLYETVKEYKARNGKLPNPDSDAGRAVTSLQLFNEGYEKLHVSKLIEHK